MSPLHTQDSDCTVARFRITTPAVYPSRRPTTIEGAVRGSAGFLSSLADLQEAQRQVGFGKPTHLYEPERGCIAVYPDHDAQSDGREVVVSLRGVEIAMVGETCEARNCDDDAIGHTSRAAFCGSCLPVARRWEHDEREIFGTVRVS